MSEVLLCVNIKQFHHPKKVGGLGSGQLSVRTDLLPCYDESDTQCINFYCFLHKLLRLNQCTYYNKQRELVLQCYICRSSLWGNLGRNLP